MKAQYLGPPLVSVLVPAFNHQEYIKCCLDSIAESSYVPLEILVIDDGSSDATYARACAWMDDNAHRVKRVTVCRQANQGITRTLNALISLARGEYIALLGSDDVLESDGIALRVSALQRHPGWLAVFGDCSVIDGVGQLQSVSVLDSMYHACIPALLNPRRIARELILRWSVAGPSLLVRRTAYDVDIGVGLYDERLQVEDRDFYLRLLSINGLGFIHATVARYRLHGENSIFSRGSNVTNDVVSAEWRNATSFRGLNRWLLTLVAVRGSVQLCAVRQKEQGNIIRGQILWFVGRILAVIQKCAHVLHRLLSLDPLARLTAAARRNGRSPF